MIKRYLLAISVFCGVAAATMPPPAHATVLVDAGPALGQDPSCAPNCPPGTVQAVALAEPQTVPEAIDTAGVAYEAIRAGEWRLAMAALLVLLVAGARRWGARLSPWLATDRGGAVLALGLAVGLEVAAVLVLDAPLGFTALLYALTTAVAAAGGRQLLRRLLWPQDSPPWPGEVR